MPDLKIVELKPSKETDNNNVEVIRLLEEALQHAREGKSQSLALLMINNDGSVLDCWHNGGRPYVMVGAMESLRLDFINANIERRSRWQISSSNATALKSFRVIWTFWSE